MAFIEIVEGMEEFLLGGFLTGDELDIVHQEQVGVSVFVAEFLVAALLQGADQFNGEFIALDIDDVVVGMLGVDLSGNGIEQVGLAQAGGAVDKQGVVGLGRLVGHGDGRRMGEPVGRADNEVIKGELGVIFNKLGLSDEFLLLFQLFFRIDLHGHVHLEQLLHGVLNIRLEPGQDDLLAEVGGRTEHQFLLGQLHHLGIVKPGGVRQQALQMDQNLRPDIGR